MPFVSGGILAEWGPAKAALHVVQQEIRKFSPKSSDDQYVVDFAFLTWHNFREPDEPYGVKPGPVGRTQRRFIVWHSVPQGLETPRDVRQWLVSVLPKPSDLFGNTCYASQRRIQQRNWPTRWQRSAITSQGTRSDRTTGGRSGCSPDAPAPACSLSPAAHRTATDALRFRCTCHRRESCAHDPRRVLPSGLRPRAPKSRRQTRGARRR